MNTSFKKIRRIVAAIAIPAIATLATASAQTQQNNQLALQLGAIQLGYTTNATWYTNTSLLGNALIQGQQALLATTTNKYTSYVYVGNTNTAATNSPLAQTATFRDQLYQATIAALTSPVFNTNKYTNTNPLSTNPIVVVTVVSSKPPYKTTTNKITSFGLNPALTTPTAVLALVSPRVPNLDPGLTKLAVDATLNQYTTNSVGVIFPVWGPQPAVATVKTLTNSATQTTAIYNLNVKTLTTQQNNAVAVAKAALTAALKAYVAGTQQWAALPKSGPHTPDTNSVYLPNFGITKLGTNSLNYQLPNQKGIANSAAAIAANAMNGLGNINTNTALSTNNVVQNNATLYGKTAANVQAMAKALTQAAVAFQHNSTVSITVNGNTIPSFPSGALGASTLGMITQVAQGTNSWGSPGTTHGITDILDGLVKGAVLAVGVTSVNLQPIATGIAQGFYADYLRTWQDSSDPAKGPLLNDADFAANTSNEANILTAFNKAGVSTTTLGSTKLNISFYLENGFANVYQAYITGDTNQYGAWNFTQNKISGAAGINLTTTNSLTLPPLLNGVGTPVTDTTGL